jgi:hypothetical protein
MMNPLYPDRISFEIDVSQLLSKETFIASFDIEQTQAPFFLGLQATRADLLFKISLVHRKFLQMQTIYLITMFGKGKMLSQKCTMPKRTICLITM